MLFSAYLLSEGIEPRKPLGKITKKKVVKNRGMINQKTLDQIEFNTTDGNNVKVQFKIEDGVGDVVFYVNDTLDDLGGRKDGSVDPEIFGGVLWVVDVYADKLGLQGLTFSAWAGKGDTKVVRGLDMEKPREAALHGLREYMKAVSEYKARVIPPSENRIALAKKLGREPTVVYDVNVGKLQGIMGEMIADIEDKGVVRSVPFEEEVYLSRNVGSGVPDNLFDLNPYTKLEDLIPGALDALELVKKYNVARMSHSEGGASVTRNRRQDLYRRLMDKFFSSKWSVEQNRDSFTLTRKGVVDTAQKESRKFSDMMNEMPAWNDGDKVISKYLGKHRMDISAAYKNKRSEELENFNEDGYQYKIFRSKLQNELSLHIFFEYKEVAAFHWLKDGRSPWKTTSAAVADAHQGKGLAFKAYTYMIDKYIHTLMSDQTLTGQEGKGSFDLWVKLGKKYPFKYVYNTSSRRYRQVQEFTRDMMDDEVERFVVSQYEL